MEPPPRVELGTYSLRVSCSLLTPRFNNNNLRASVKVFASICAGFVLALGFFGVSLDVFGHQFLGPTRLSADRNCPELSVCAEAVYSAYGHIE